MVVPYSSLKAQVFEESSDAAGLAHTLVPFGRISSGLAVFDFDNDGDDDIYVVGGRQPDALYRNDGSGNFENIAAEFGIVAATENTTTISVITGDLDNDGYREIFLGTYLKTTGDFSLSNNLLLQFNVSTGRYEEVSFPNGLSEAIWTASATFFDANQDGFLDLYLTDYIDTPGFDTDTTGTVTGFNHECGEDRFYLGDGDGSFTENTDLFGPGNTGCGLATLSTDTDNDGDLDLIVINDFGQWVEPDALYRNDWPNAGFADDDATATFRNQHYGMGIAAGDVNEDLMMDYYITNIGRNAFMVNEGNNVFSRQEASYRIKDEFTNFGNFTTGWGTFFADLNNDTYLDLYVGNGFVNSAVDVDDSRQADKVYRGLPVETGRFFDASSTSGITDTLTTRGAVYADLDNNGLLDILVLTVEGGFFPTKLRYYKNVTPDAGNFIGFRLSSDEGNRDAYGSRITAYAGGRAFLREHVCGGSHGSQHSSLIHFGLGDIPAVDSVSVRWPDGRVGWLYEPTVNTVHEIARGDLLSSVDVPVGPTALRISPNPTEGELAVAGITASSPYFIFDLNGRRVATGIVSLSDNRIDLLSLNPGLYVLRIGRQTAKFVVR